MGVLLLLGCGGGGVPGPGGIQVTISPGSITISANGRVVFCAIVSNFVSPEVTWSSSAGVIASLGTGRGRLTAPSAPTVLTVTATSVEDPTKSDSATVTVVSGFATVNGRVLRSSSSFGLASVVIRFLNAAGSQVATATSNPCGDFAAAVPTTATRFHIQLGTVPPGYFNQYTYNSDRFTVLEPT